MTDVVYPRSLPGPMTAPFQPAERRLLSSVPGPRQSSVFQRDRGGAQPVTFIFRNRALLQEWVDWYELYAGAWFAASWPLPQGGVGVRRFVGAPTYLGYLPIHGGWGVSIDCRLRGRGVLPGTSPVVIFTAACVPAIPGATGATALLSWTVTDADTISISGGIGSVADSGTHSAAVSVEYTLTATNAAGTTVVKCLTPGSWENYEAYVGMPIMHGADSDELAQEAAEWYCSARGGVSSWIYVGEHTDTSALVEAICNDSAVSSAILLYTAC